MKAFTDTLREINGGKFAEELNAELQALVLAVRDVGKSGSISVTLKLKPTRGLALEIEHDFSVKSPEFQRPAEIMFATADGSLVRNNPDQGKLDLKEVTPPQSGALREVRTSMPPPPGAPHDPDTGEIKNVVPAAAAS